VVPAFLNPADNRYQTTGWPYAGMGLTHFVGMAGVEARRSDVSVAELPRTDPRAGVFGYHGVASQADISDGTSNTIMVIGSGELAAPWIQGGGATVRGAQARTTKDGKPDYFDDLMGFGSRGLAQKGAVVMMADGSVRTISANVDPKVFAAMCTIHGADSVDLSVLGEAPKGP
jgi:hypothetical protein